MKKWFIVPFMFILMACQTTTSIDTITIWHDKEQAIADVIEAHLQEAFPNTTFNLVRRESLTDTLKLVGNTASSAPDLFIFAHDKVGLFAEIGILEPITSFLDTSELEVFLPITLEAATYQDTLYQLPFYFETLLFMYNQDRLSSDEVPTTTDDLLEYMRNVTDARRFGFVEQHSNAYYAAGWIHAFGGRLIDADGTPLLNDPKTLEALRYQQQFITYMPRGQAEYATINTLFYERRANAIIGGPWMVPTARERGINLGFAPMPIVNQTGVRLSPFMGVQGIHVLKVAVQDEAKHAFIGDILRHLIDPQLGIELAKVAGIAPAHQEAYNDDFIQTDPLVQAMYEAASSAIPMSNLPQMDILWVTAADMLVQINLRGQDIEITANEAQRRSEDLIRRME